MIEEGPGPSARYIVLMKNAYHVVSNIKPAVVFKKGLKCIRSTYYVNSKITMQTLLRNGKLAACCIDKFF